MQLTVTSVDYAPEELHDQVPFVVNLLRPLPGPDRPDYWLGELPKTLFWNRPDGHRVDVRHVVLCARWEGTQIAQGVENLAIGMAYVTNQLQVTESAVDFDKCRYVAIGLAHDTGRTPTKKRNGVLAGRIARMFGR